jgi:hypothetical protein
MTAEKKCGLIPGTRLAEMRRRERLRDFRG